MKEDSFLLASISRRDVQRATAFIAAQLRGNKGFVLGEAAVVSKCVHLLQAGAPGEVGVFRNRDAGKEFLQKEEPGQVLHLDVLHEPACADARALAARIAETLRRYEEWKKEHEKLGYARRILLSTGTGAGTVADLLFFPSRPLARKLQSHVHILWDDLPPEDFPLLLCLVDAVETELALEGIETRKVVNVLHLEGKKIPGSPFSFPRCGPGEHHLWQLAAELTSILGGPEEVLEFLDSFRPLPFWRKKSAAELRNKHGNLRALVLALAEAGIIKRGWLADTLTSRGKELLDFVSRHQKELSAQLRRIIRSVPAPEHRYHEVRRFSPARSRHKKYAYRGKTVAVPDDSWVDNIAVPETLLEALKRRPLRETGALEVRREDLRVYERVATKPVDVCLLLDGSSSMAGPKIKAVWHLAEHILLTSRDKIAVVVFQHREARVVVPFTRNYTKLRAGLRSIQPAGLTPLADGIARAVELIKKSYVRNPLLVLITDGVPTFGKWTLNPRQDALRAAKTIPEARARLVCIGIAPNREFLEELAQAAGGTVYIVESLEEKAALVEIVQRERRISSQ